MAIFLESKYLLAARSQVLTLGSQNCRTKELNLLIYRQSFSRSNLIWFAVQIYVFAIFSNAYSQKAHISLVFFILQ